MELSLIIPAYNEAQRLPRFLRDAVGYLDRQFPGEYEIIVVNDGSIDGTAAAVQPLIAGQSFIRVISHQVNRGKGAAVQTGMRFAHGRLRLFADADGSTPIEEERRLRTVIEVGADLAIGSRATRSLRGVPSFANQFPDEEEIKWNVQLHRYFMGRTFAALTKMIVGLNYADSQCGFKMFRADVAEDLFGRLTLERFIFDVEILYLAEKHGYRVSEVPVNWHEVQGSKVHLAYDSWRMFWELWQIRHRYTKLLRNNLVQRAKPPVTQLKDGRVL